MTAARLAAACALAAAVLVAWSAAAAQNGARVVEGRVIRPGAAGPAPVAGAWVVLHRVGPDTAGPLDSVRSRADGSYTIHYRAFGSAQAVYFVATKYDGIAYLSSALSGPRVAGADGDLTVFDTTSSGVTVHERGRHVIVFAPEADGGRNVMEVYELANDADRTLVPGGAGRPAWSAPLAPGAADFRAEQGDVSTGGMSAGQGRVEVYAPFAPGLKQLSFSYRLPKNAWPLTLPAARDTLVLEVLLEETSGSATGGGLRAQGPQLVQGRTFLRFLAPNAPPQSAVVIAPGAAPHSRMTYAVLALVLAIAGAMLIALFAALRRS